MPLAVGASCIQLLQNYDAVFWQGLIPKALDAKWLPGRWYMPAQTIGFGLTQFTVPLALVMLPRIARSAAQGERSNSFRLTLLATLALGGAAALGCTLFPKLPLQIMFFNKPQNWEASPMVPWFAWTLLTFTVANVFLTQLFGQGRFGIIGWVIAVAVSYVTTLTALGPRLLTMAPFDGYRAGVQVMALHMVALLAGALWVSRDALRAVPAKS